jgi:hypothetical protein
MSRNTQVIEDKQKTFTSLANGSFFSWKFEAAKTPVGIP